MTLIHADALKTKHVFNPDILALVSDCLKKARQCQVKSGFQSSLQYQHAGNHYPFGECPANQFNGTHASKGNYGPHGGKPWNAGIRYFIDYYPVVFGGRGRKNLVPASVLLKPEVYSAIVRITVNKEKYAGRITDYPFFVRVISAIFTSRRKTLLNSLEQLSLPNVSRERLKRTIKDMQLDERIRGEALNIDQLITLAEAIRGTMLKTLLKT